MKIKIGADPELFLLRDGYPISAAGLLPGTKEQPHAVNKGAVQVDGMAAEFNINPADTADEFKTNIRTVMEQLRGLIPKEYELGLIPSVFFSKEHMERQPKEALELGCNPDFNAYTGQVNPKPDPKALGYSDQMQRLRTAAGHVHIGWTEDVDPMDPDHFHSCRSLVKQLDYALALPSAILDDTDESAQRRDLYGRTGAFRPKKYGCEYRVLSNFWLKDDKYIKWVFDTVNWAVQALLDGNRLYETQKYPGYPSLYLDRGYKLTANDQRAIKSVMKEMGIPCDILQT